LSQKVVAAFVITRRRQYVFMFSGLSAENIKKNSLCVLRVFAVKISFQQKNDRTKDFWAPCNYLWNVFDKIKAVA